MDAPPVNAQASETPFKDVAELGMAIARAKGLDAASVKRQVLSALGSFLPRQMAFKTRECALQQIQGKFANRPIRGSEWSREMGSDQTSIAALDPALIRRDQKEEARVGNLDHRLNHWTAVRNGLMNAHADIFPHVPSIAKALPNPIDQMKVFELIQIIPTPTRAALKSGMLATYRISDPTVMRFLRNNSVFAFGQADRARTSATFREILDAMWLFNDKFERARSSFEEINARPKD